MKCQTIYHKLNERRLVRFMSNLQLHQHVPDSETDFLWKDYSKAVGNDWAWIEAVEIVYDDHSGREYL